MTTPIPGIGESSFNPTCNITFEDQWVPYRNTLSRDPCQVAGSLLASQECATSDNATNTTSILRSILENGDPRAAVPDIKNPCFCTSPVYALVSFCRACRILSFTDVNSVVFANWHTWSSRCDLPPSPPLFAPFPFQTLLEREHVMKWTSDNRSFDDNTGDFSIRKTRGLVVFENFTEEFGPPDSTATSPGNDNNPPTGPGNGSSSTNDQSTPSASHKPPVGAIVGGVVGGVALIVLLGLLFWLFRRRRKGTKEAPSAAYIRACGGQLATNMHVATPYVAGNRESAQYPNEKAILAERENNSLQNTENMEKPVRKHSNTGTSASEAESFDPYTISETDRLQRTHPGDTSP